MFLVKMDMERFVSFVQMYYCEKIVQSMNRLQNLERDMVLMIVGTILQRMSSMSTMSVRLLRGADNLNYVH